MREICQKELLQHLKNISYYGYTVVKSGLEENEVNELLTLVKRFHFETNDTSYKGLPENDIKPDIVYNLQNKHKSFIDTITSHSITNILIEKLNDPYYSTIPSDKGNFTLNYFNARSSKKFLDLHNDSHLPMTGKHTYSMQVALILEDQRIDNGCTFVVPGSHLVGEFADREFDLVRPLETKAGDIVFWDSRIWHGAYVNTSSQTRWSIIATFCSWWLKPTMDIPRSLPDSIYQQLSPEQKAILGFCSIPPQHETERINTKSGYSSLKKHVQDYFK